MLLEGKFLEKINSDLNVNLQPIEIDGQFHHFTVDGKKEGNKKPIWVVGKTWEYKGNPYFIVTYGDFRGGITLTLASYDIKDQTPQFRKAHNEQVKALEDKTKAEKEEARKKGIEKWRPVFYECNPKSAVHDYMKLKGFEENFRARVTSRNTLLIPVEGVDSEAHLTFEGVQMIFFDVDSNQYRKLFNTGLIKKGCFSRLGEFDLKKSEFVYIAEGYATAGSVYQATNIATVCCFDSGNINHVIHSLKVLNPDVKIIIACDDDFQTVIAGKHVNVGLNKAISAQKKFQNVTYRKPVFRSRLNETDFNDLMVMEGLDVVAEQLKLNRNEFSDVVLLGHKDHETFYYLCTQSKSIVGLKASQHKGEHLKGIANEKYWAEKYGARKDKDDNLIPNWSKISDVLLERQREIGPFDVKKIRGVGVWEDQGRIFVNTGNGVYREDKKMILSNIDPHLDTKNFYKYSPSQYINFDDGLTDEESQKIVDAFKHIRFKSGYDYVYVCGFIAIANVFGALDWRPHLWVSGESGSGKSWVLKKIQELIYFSFATKYSTASGVSQHLSDDAKAVVYDEAEAHMPMMPAVLDLARQCSTRKGDVILRGSVSGEAHATEVNACFCMGSIQPPKMDKADDSRFFIVDLHELDGQTSDELKELLKAFKAIEGMGQRLMVRMVNNFATLKKNIEFCKMELREQGIKAREADQLSSVIAGFCMLMFRTELTKELIQMVVDQMGLKNSDYVERNETPQDDECFTALLQLDLDGQGCSLGQAIKMAKMAKETPEVMKSHGMIWDMKREALFISNNSPKLDRKMGHLKFPNFRKVLKRSKNYEGIINKRVGWTASGQSKGMLLKVNSGLL